MKKDTQEAELLPPQNQSLTRHEPINVNNPVEVVTGLMQTVLQGGITQESVGTMEKLVALFERMQGKAAEQKFNEAFAAMQNEMPNVHAKEPVPNRDGTVRYVFAPYEAIMDAVQPFLVKHGFAVSFSTRYDDKRIVKICTLRHINGHSVSNEFAVRIGQGPPNASEAQADGAAGTYAKRHALCDALNIVIDNDTDARSEGGAITKEQADSLRKRVRESGADEERFLKYAGAATFEEIPESMFAALDANLKKKEKTA